MRSSHTQRVSGGLLLLLSTVAACSAQPSTDQLTKELEAVASWAATAHMIGDGWLKHSVPTVYATQTLQTAEEEFGKKAETIAQVAPNEHRKQSQAQVQAIEQTVTQMANAIAQDDRSAVTQRLQTLSHQEQALAQWVESTGESP